MSDLVERLRGDVCHTVIKECNAAADKIEEQQAELKATVTTKYHDDLMHEWHTETVKLQARISELEAIRDAAEKCSIGCRRCNHFDRYKELKRALAALGGES